MARYYLLSKLGGVAFQSGFFDPTSKTYYSMSGQGCIFFFILVASDLGRQSPWAQKNDVWSYSVVTNSWTFVTGSNATGFGLYPQRQNYSQAFVDEKRSAPGSRALIPYSQFSALEVEDSRFLPGARKGSVTVFHSNAGVAFQFGGGRDASKLISGWYSDVW